MPTLYNGCGVSTQLVEMDYNSGHATNYAHVLAVSDHKAEAERILAEFLDPHHSG